MDSTATEFGEPIRSLLTPEGEGLRPMPLVPSRPSDNLQLDALRALSTEDLFDKIERSEFARCVHAGLYLYFSALDESHKISQGIASASGSYWHGIMHRQEGDWSNAKYWFRRVGSHPVLDALGAQTRDGWDPFDFIDRCSVASAGGPGQDELAGLQMEEWRLLMRYCYRHAVGG